MTKDSPQPVGAAAAPPRSAESAALDAELGAAGPHLAGNAELLRCVLAGSGDCIKILDLEGRLQFMSEGGKRVMEVDDFSALKGCIWAEFWHDEGRTHAQAALAAAMEGKTYRFRHWANTAKGSRRQWDVEVSPIPGVDGRPEYLLSISRDITAQIDAETQLQESVERQRWLMGELAHRLKNSFATVVSIARQTFRGPQFDASRDVFVARIRMLDAANELLTRTDWSDTRLQSAVSAAMAPHCSDPARLSIEGPDLHIGAQPAMGLMLALHELATNASKYGALSNDVGHIDIRWSTPTIAGEPGFEFVWRESGGPPVKPPARTGFGSRLIERVLAAEFGGAARLDYPAEGVIFRLTTTLDKIGAADSKTGGRTEPAL